MWRDIIIIAGVFVLRTLIDWGVKHSKTTENTLDDVIFANLKKFADTLKFKK